MALSIVLLLAFTIIIFFILVQLLLFSSNMYTDPQLTSLESGFELVKNSMFLSSSFFLLAFVFVMFDVELILIFPFAFFKSIKYSNLLVLMIVFLFIISTLFFEWMLVGLKWQS